MKQRTFLPLSFLLVIFVFIGVSCGIDDEPLEYGSPYAYFRTYGIIVDELTSEKIEGIKVTFNGKTTVSNELGEYIIDTKNSITDQVYTLIFTDVDGDQNKSYSRLDTVIDFSDIEYVGGSGSWNYGDKSIRVDVELSQPDL